MTTATGTGAKDLAMTENTSKAASEIIGASVPQPLADAVRALAERDDRSVSWEIREALRRFLGERGLGV